MCCPNCNPNSSPLDKQLHNLALEIADAGRSEEYYQKLGNAHLYTFYKDKRLALTKQRQSLKGQQ